MLVQKLNKLLDYNWDHEIPRQIQLNTKNVDPNSDPWALNGLSHFHEKNVKLNRYPWFFWFSLDLTNNFSCCLFFTFDRALPSTYNINW